MKNEKKKIKLYKNEKERVYKYIKSKKGIVDEQTRANDAALTTCNAHLSTAKEKTCNIYRYIL